MTGLSVVLPAFDDTARLRERISELHGTLSQRFDPIEYVVVDDAGATDLDSLRSVAPDVRLFENRANLGKGASGQAVQNMNLMLGLNEREGLS